MIYQVGYFIWENHRVTHKRSQMTVENRSEILPKIKKKHQSDFISIQKIGLDDGQHDKNSS